MILTIEYDVFDLCVAINTTPNAGILASVRNTED